MKYWGKNKNLQTNRRQTRQEKIRKELGNLGYAVLPKLAES